MALTDAALTVSTAPLSWSPTLNG